MLELATVYNVAFVVYSMRAVRDVLIFCCVPNPQLSRSTTSYSLSYPLFVHPSIHPYIYSTSELIRAILVYASQPESQTARRGSSPSSRVPFSQESLTEHQYFSPSLSSIPWALSLPSLCRRVVHSRKFRRCRCLGAASTKPVKLLSLSLFFIWLLVPLCSSTSTIVNYFWLESPHYFLPAEIARLCSAIFFFWYIFWASWNNVHFNISLAKTTLVLFFRILCFSGTLYYSLVLPVCCCFGSCSGIYLTILHFHQPVETLERIIFFFPLLVCCCCFLSFFNRYCD